MLVLPSPKSMFNVQNSTPASRVTSLEKFRPKQKAGSASLLKGVQAPLVYVVDDEPHLTELYKFILEAKGCFVRTFTDRVEALAALKHEDRKPDLLVFDYLGNSMLADRFMNLFLAASPGLRILMASGLNRSEVRFSSVKPDRFLQKPFTPEEFLSEVKAVLTAQPSL